MLSGKRAQFAHVFTRPQAAPLLCQDCFSQFWGRPLSPHSLEETHTSLSRAPCRSCNLLDISCASTPESIHRCRRDRHLPRTQPRAAHLALTPTCQQPKYNSLPLSALSPEIRVTHGAVTRPASAAARPTRVIKRKLPALLSNISSLSLSLCCTNVYLFLLFLSS